MLTVFLGHFWRASIRLLLSLEMMDLFAIQQNREENRARSENDLRVKEACRDCQDHCVYRE